jgi:hypothetical protein
MDFTVFIYFGALQIPPNFDAILKWVGYRYFEILMTFINFED